MDTAWTVLTDATIKAIHLIAQGKEIELNRELTASILKEVMKEMIPTIQQEWKEAVDSDLSEAWLKELMKGQAIETAIKVLKRMEVL